MLSFLWDWWPIIAMILGTVGIGGVIVVAIGWPVVASFLVGTKLGRWTCIVVAGFLILAFLAASAHRKGVLAERARLAAEKAKNVARRIKNDEKIRNMSRDQLRREFAKWVR